MTLHKHKNKAFENLFNDVVIKELPNMVRP